MSHLVTATGQSRADVERDVFRQLLMTDERLRPNQDHWLETIVGLKQAALQGSPPETIVGILKNALQEV